MAKPSRRDAEAARRERAAQIGFGVYRGLHKTKLSADTQQILPAAVTGQTTTETKPDTVANPTKIQGVIAYDTAGYPGPGTPGAGTLSHDHVTGPVTYAVTPPVGGQQFVDTFRNSKTYSPEYGSPVDGVPVQTGGQPSINGSSKANPAGAAG